MHKLDGQDGVVVVVQEWAEYERGWGNRFDGFSIHADAAEHNKFVTDHWNNMPLATPDEYTVPQGKALYALAPESIREDILVAKLKGQPLWIHKQCTEWIQEALKSNNRVNDGKKTDTF